MKDTYMDNYNNTYSQIDTTTSGQPRNVHLNVSLTIISLFFAEFILLLHKLDLYACIYAVLWCLFPRVYVPLKMICSKTNDIPLKEYIETLNANFWLTLSSSLVTIITFCHFYQ